MRRRPPRSTRTDTLFPYTTLFRSLAAANADLDTKVDVLRLAMLQAALAEFPATGHVLNPIDWAEIELTKITDGGYLFANPQNDSQPRLWGIPVAETQATPTERRIGKECVNKCTSRWAPEHQKQKKN